MDSHDLAVGDVVFGQFPYQDGVGSKPRPLLIVKLEAGKIHCVGCQITTKNRTETSLGYWIDSTHKYFRELGLKQPSFINLDHTANILFSQITHKIGYCPSDMLDNIMDLLGFDD